MAVAAAMSLSDKACHAIRDEILRGRLRPGTPLSRRRLARQLGMSVLPVTDALRRLVGDGALVSGDVPRADTAMRAHVRYVLVEVTGQLGALTAVEWRERSPSRKASARAPVRSLRAPAK